MNGLMGGIGAGLASAAQGLRANQQRADEQRQLQELMAYRQQQLQQQGLLQALKLKQADDQVRAQEQQRQQKLQRENDESVTSQIGNLRAFKALGLGDGQFNPKVDYAKLQQEQLKSGLMPKMETRIVPEIGAGGNPVNVAYGLMGGKLDPASRQVLGYRPTSDGISMTSPDGTTVQIGGKHKVPTGAVTDAFKSLPQLKDALEGVSDYRAVLRELGNKPALLRANQKDVLRLRSAMNNAILAIGPDMARGALQQHEQEMVEKILGGDPTTIGAMMFNSASTIDGILEKLGNRMRTRISEQEALARGDAKGFFGVRPTATAPSNAARQLIEQVMNGQ